MALFQDIPFRVDTSANPRCFWIMWILRLPLCAFIHALRRWRIWSVLPGMALQTCGSPGREIASILRRQNEQFGSNARILAQIEELAIAG